MSRRIRTLLILGFAFVAVAGDVVPAQACPMCRQAVEAEEEENMVPQAYMFSILFMLAMPATLFAAFGFFFYRMTKRAAALAAISNAAGPHHLSPHQAAHS